MGKPITEAQEDRAIILISDCNAIVDGIYNRLANVLNLADDESMQDGSESCVLNARLNALKSQLDRLLNHIVL